MSENINIVDFIDGILEDLVDMVLQHARSQKDEHGNIIYDSGGLSVDKTALKTLSDLGILKEIGDPKYPRYLYEPGASTAFVERVRKQQAGLERDAETGRAAEAMSIGYRLSKHKYVVSGKTEFSYCMRDVYDDWVEVKRAETAHETLILSPKEQL